MPGEPSGPDPSDLSLSFGAPSHAGSLTSTWSSGNGTLPGFVTRSV